MAQRSAWMARSACSRNNRRMLSAAAAPRRQAVTEASSAAGAIERDVMQYDVVIVGAGPAGLACAIRLKQLKPDINVCVLEKASAVGAHGLSGAVIEPGPLDALAPEWRQSPPGIFVAAKRDEFRLLTRTGSVPLPLPPHLHN